MTTTETRPAPAPASGRNGRGPVTPVRAGRRRLPGLALGLAAAVALFAVMIMVSLAIGTKELSITEVWTGVVQPDDSYASVVVETRIPRTVLGVVAGASLAVAGVLIQGITRNPLGDPGLLGVNAGASAAIVTGMAFFGLGAAPVWVAIPGAFAAVAVVYVVGSGRGGASPLRLVLAGAVVNAVLVAYIEAVALTNPSTFDTYRFWVIGSLSGRGFDVIAAVLPVAVAGLLLTVILLPGLNALALGDETAHALGAPTTVIRIGGAAGATMLSAAATAACGPIAFVGLAVPHIVRPFVGTDHRWLVPYCAALGPVLLLGADVIGRVVARPGELMVGVVIAFIGAPMLMLTVRRLKGSA
ncbi:iron ABC transporter permease [Actinobacteria bacterium YIM 96077]|uniref:Iron ABC transporter permease n=1 Tax=Phytoactinopolyspora halophila TaxID=1981511 RepID=A0A329R207_9ACTN|nr:iron ABC transporter permease [Phytoactinopolyspora halophila]AYY12099.1 iron ABC transporter permease [Actinobacteria bacterium YIM 96077]RAW18665.1 iron ABC transporter permease [Phytoactinopolyspora halophila]